METQSQRQLHRKSARLRLRARRRSEQAEGPKRFMPESRGLHSKTAATTLRRRRTKSERKLLPFGEFLVRRGVISRHQLLQALRLQDDNPHLRLGQALVTLAVLSARDVERYHRSFAIEVIEIEQSIAE